MSEVIDTFKYNALLAELESLKGKKKPVQDFIRKIYKLSNGFRYFNELYIKQPQTAKHALILATKAISYDSSKRPLKQEIKSSIEELANFLIARSIVSPDEVEEVYKYYVDTIQLVPNDLDELLKQDKLVEKLDEKTISIYLSTYLIRELRALSNGDIAARAYLLANNPNSRLAKILTLETKHSETRAFEEIQNLIRSLQNILNACSINKETTHDLPIQ